MWTGRVIFSRCMRHLRTRGMMRLRICLERRSLCETKTRTSTYTRYFISLLFFLFSRFLCHSARLLFVYSSCNCIIPPLRISSPSSSIHYRHSCIMYTEYIVFCSWKNDVPEEVPCLDLT